MSAAVHLAADFDSETSRCHKQADYCAEVENIQWFHALKCRSRLQLCHHPINMKREGDVTCFVEMSMPNFKKKKNKQETVSVGC